MLRLKPYGIDVYKHGRYWFFTVCGLSITIFKPYYEHDFYFWKAKDKNGKTICSRNAYEIYILLKKIGI